ncbi:malto-oligosyltrehalose trehalohydrolase [Pedobacter zeae]|uniref:Malto-oligosyltrehalose trehalohydrolase n=1 Tax=Pedobacter zeae TaxID=1737356 RepID=A0A7W6KB16_9SPHI|nr:malto-oligosyltrehalose trehalohydrolase [Pedobacter zeae]MBB4108357.1 maltooligosyltrehalose trehalohydrolase [Pedobacter zeae]GGG93292.1 malto-oligosyltrehalose trehalohydrolase [Pedobacter zeae]
MKIDIQRRQIGLNFKDGNAELRIWAPLAWQVLVLSGGTSLHLEKEDRGYWFLQTNKIQPGDQYQLKIVTQESGIEPVLRPDPATLNQPAGLTGPSKALDLAYAWTDAAWQCPDPEKFIIYELHTGTFSHKGDFKGIAEKLDHMLALGITAIELMPVAQFPGGRNWGYDGVFPFAVQESYGGAKGLQELVDSCHSKGIAVILDVVYNHFGPEGNHFADFGPYFTDKYHTPWGQAINFDDAQSDGVRSFFIENCLMWFRDFHIDALRLDAVHAIRDFSAVHFLEELRQYTDQLSASTNKTFYLIAEVDLNNNRYINPFETGGYGMHAQWMDEFHHTLRVAAGGERIGYYSDFNGVDHLAKSYRDAYVYDGWYSPHREKTFGRPALNNPGKQFVVFSQNHDQVGNRMLGERSSSLYRFELLKVMAGAVFCSPYLPLIFMGEEWAETRPFQFFTSHTDPGLIEAVREGRKAEFSAFQGEQEPTDPQSLATFEASKLDWNKVGTGKHQLMLQYYRQLISLRKNSPVLSKLDRSGLKAIALADQNCLILERSNSIEKVVCLMNFSPKAQLLKLPEGAAPYILLLDSSSARWGGPGQGVKAVLADNQVTIFPESILIFSAQHVSS